jgi:hypothetical protein
VELLLFYKSAINDLEILMCYSEQAESAIQIYIPQRQFMNFICRLVCSLLRVFVAGWKCADVSEEYLVYIIRGLIKRVAGFSETSNSLDGIASDKAVVLIIIALQTTNLEFVSYQCSVSTSQREGSEIYFQDSLSHIDFPVSEASHIISS